MEGHESPDRGRSEEAGRNKEETMEREVSELLTEGEMERDDPGKAARERLSPKYEIRIQTESDPIVEETLRYRKMALEVDRRYEKYMSRVPQHKADREEEK